MPCPRHAWRRSLCAGLAAAETRRGRAVPSLLLLLARSFGRDSLPVQSTGQAGRSGSCLSQRSRRTAYVECSGYCKATSAAKANPWAYCSPINHIGFFFCTNSCTSAVAVCRGDVVSGSCAILSDLFLLLDSLRCQ